MDAIARVGGIFGGFMNSGQPHLSFKSSTMWVIARDAHNLNQICTSPFVYRNTIVQEILEILFD